MQLQTLEHDPGLRTRPAPPTPRPPRRRYRRRQPVRSGAIALAAGAALLFVLATPVVLLLVWVANTADAMIAGLPELPSEFEAAPQRSVVLDRNGKRLATLQVENRVAVDIERVPEHMINAVLATEDHTFWKHAGVNWGAVTRSALRLASSGEVEGGGSTITQQVVKNRFVGDEQSFQRKIIEAALAAQVERTISKEEILETYLNDTYFGNGAYGVAAAAEYYWSKPVEDLTLGDAALLAGIIRAPEVNNPVDSPDKAQARRTIVLEQMAEVDLITPERAAKVADSPIKLDVKEPRGNRSPFLIDIVRAELQRDPALGDTPEERWDMALRGGLKIRTTLDRDLQRIAEKTIDDVLPRKKKDPLASIVAVDPASGEMLAAAVGPKDYGEGDGKTTINPAVPGLGSNGRPPGSTFKAFELVAALEHEVSRAHVFESGPTYVSENPACAGAEFTNYGGADLGAVDMATATAKSSNTYFVHLLDLAGGPEALVDVAHRMGVDSELEPHCATVLGSESVFPVEMATAFGTLANEGRRCEPHTVRAIRDSQGEVLTKDRGDCDRAIDKEIAHTVTHLLRGPIESGTASANGQIGRPAAGKTGTTTDNKDAWFVGYIPQLSAATWVGHEMPETLVHPLCGEVTGGCLPTILWQRFMTQAVDVLQLPVEDFPEPPPPPVREVPSVVGMDEEEAAQTLIDAGFLPSAQVVDGEPPAGTVVEQSPAGGEEVPEGSQVSISVSNGEAEPELEFPDLPIDPPDIDLPDLPDDLPTFPPRGDDPPGEPGIDPPDFPFAPGNGQDED
ncbi:MAG TPA: transglycosylase domain-containing protein [Euzebyales bacterium]|nr:transglycosylase domain-containing protein [Euzebyales bacterium]